MLDTLWLVGVWHVACVCSLQLQMIMTLPQRDLQLGEEGAIALVPSLLTLTQVKVLQLVGTHAPSFMITTALQMCHRPLCQ